MKKIFLHCLFLISAEVVLSQNQIIGTVLDTSGEVLELVTVELFSLPDTVWQKASVSDGSGVFQIENIADGHYFLRLSRLGYETMNTTSFQLPNENIPTPFQLKTSITDLAAVTVRSTRPLFVQKADHLVVNIPESIAQGNSLLEILQKTPNVLFDPQSNTLTLQGKAGLSIFIDGKPQYMDAAALLDLLSSLSASDIDRLEIFHNPPARFKAAGSAGIINIITQNSFRAERLTWNTFTEKGRSWRVGTSLNYALKGEKVSWNLNYSFANRNHLRLVQLDRSINYQNQDILLQQISERKTTPYHQNLQTSIRYPFNERTTLSANFKFFHHQHRDELVDNTSIFLNTVLDSIIRLQNTEQLQPYRFIFNTNLQHQFWQKKANISLDIDYAKVQRVQNNTFKNQFFTASEEVNSITESLVNEQLAALSIVALRSDFTYRLTEQVKLEAGISLSNTPLEYDNDFFNLLGKIQERNDFFSNQLVYQEQIRAAYTSLHFDYLGIQFQTGLRLEQTLADIDQRDAQVINRLNYTNLFPSIFLTKTLQEKHQLNASFGRRIDRPNYIDLSPYRRFISYYTHIAGNPNVQPQFTNNYSLIYNFLPKNISLNLNYNRTRDLLSFLPSQNDSSRLELVQRTNIDQRDQWALSIALPAKLLPKSTGQFNISFLHTAFNGEQVDYNQSNTRFSYTINANQSVEISNDFHLDAAFQYFSKAFYGFIVAEDRWQLNLALRKKVWKERLQLQLGIDDIFNQNRFLGHLAYNNLDVRFDNRWESRMLRVTASFRFGDQDLRPFSSKTNQAEQGLRRL